MYAEQIYTLILAKTNTLEVKLYKNNYTTNWYYIAKSCLIMFYA